MWSVIKSVKMRAGPIVLGKKKIVNESTGYLFLFVSSSSQKGRLVTRARATGEVIYPCAISSFLFYFVFNTFFLFPND